MTKSPEISVIMPVYNESLHDLHESINSILNQTYHNFEYIIVDDNPKSYRIKKFLLDEYNRNNKIKLIFNQRNIGVIKASNKAIKQAKGQFINRMDADDIVKPDKLNIQLKFLLRYHLDFVCSNFSIINSNDKLTRLYGYNSKTTINQSKIKRILMHCNIAMGPTLFFKKSCFETVHGYRETNVEDYDLASRFLIYGYKIGYLNFPLIYKRLRKNSISYKTILIQYIIMKTISKYLHKYDFTKIVPIKLLKYNVNKLFGRQILHFNKFVKARYLFNDYKTFSNTIILLWYIFSSKIVIKWCVWSLKNKIYQ